MTLEHDKPPRKSEQYYCVEAQLPPPFRELFLEVLWELGTLGVEEFDRDGEGRSLAYFDASRPLEELRSQVETSLLDMGCGEGRIQFHRLSYDDRAWIEKFNQTFVGFEVSPTFWVYPPWDNASDQHRVNILLEPGHGFGTGTHESTQLALEAIESCVESCTSMLDFGTGSGILAVAGKRLKPELQVVAFDNDPLAAAAAAKTFRDNGIPDISLFAGEGGVLHPRFDLVAANLTAAIISQVSTELERLTGRWLVVSGFTISEVEFVSAVLQLSGALAERRRWGRNDWVSVLFERCDE